MFLVCFVLRSQRDDFKTLIVDMAPAQLNKFLIFFLFVFVLFSFILF